MHYVCIENNAVISILNYSPSVPNSVTVFEINNADYDAIVAQTHHFDVTTKTVKPVDPLIISRKTTEQQNATDLEFLRSTDWQVLRHIRQTALGIQTSLSPEQYLALEQQRQAAATRIVKT